MMDTGGRGDRRGARAWAGMLAGELRSPIDSTWNEFWSGAVSIGLSRKHLSALGVLMQGCVDRSLSGSIRTATARHSTVLHVNSYRWSDREAGTPVAADHPFKTSK